jgi:porphobilinogen synthase
VQILSKFYQNFMTNFYSAKFPELRLRRNRKHQWIRDLVAQNQLSTSDLILPLFVCEGKNQSQKIENLPDIFRYSPDNILKKIQEAKNLGIKAVMLFPVVDQKLKSHLASEAWNKNNLICTTIKMIKDQIADIGVIADVALDPYTASGQDGLVDDLGFVVNDSTIEALCKQSLTLAEAGVDIIAPSDMMDGRVVMIRKALDENGFSEIGICSYSVKYASHFYGPFRHAVGSAKNLKNADKKTYQMDFRNADEAMREIALDVQEGADMIIIKPALSYLDVIYRAKQNFQLPIITYQVSGEYAMLKLAHHQKIIDFEIACYENMIAMKRAGCSAIISYASLEMAKFLKNIN